MPSHSPARRPLAVARLMLGITVLGILLFTYIAGIPRQGANPFDYFGFFTNLTSLLSASLLMVVGCRTLRGSGTSELVTTLRAISMACLIVVGVVYNVLVPGTGSAPAWVSVTLHTVFPTLMILDWTLVGDRTPRPWRTLWVVLPYPLIWLVIVLVRGATDGWVPYGFLLPSQGIPSLTVHVLGLLAGLLASGVIVWALSRSPGLAVLRQPPTLQP